MTDAKTSKRDETRDLVFTRVFDASIERVWKAWLRPAAARKEKSRSERAQTPREIRIDSLRGNEGDDRDSKE